jgi:hypothetical protein
MTDHNKKDDGEEEEKHGLIMNILGTRIDTFITPARPNP